MHRNDSGYCDTHEAQARKAYDDTRQTAAERGYGALWAKISRGKRRRTPMCEAEGCHALAEMVHHRDGNPRNNREANLMSICRACHEAIHGPDRFRPRGGGEGKIPTASSHRPAGLPISRSAKIEPGGQFEL